MPTDQTPERPAQRIPPLPPGARDDRTAELLQSLPHDPDGGEMNLFATLAHHPRLLNRWTAFGGTLLYRGELSARERELLILRTAWHCRADYEWGHHTPMAREAGITEDEIDRVRLAGTATGWSAEDASLLDAADELHRDARIGDQTWTALAGRYTHPQLIE